jgi:REP element-mobilizing transposase RayT
MPLAYFITFTTYGTWLHGSSKGSVDRQHNIVGMPVLEHDTGREQYERRQMSEPAYSMTPVEREIVCQAIVELSLERDWRLVAAHVRSNHVHVVITADRDPGRIMSELKARASAKLNQAGFDNSTRKRWTRHGSTRYLLTEDEFEAKIRYTLDEQGERMACYANEPRTK